MTGAPDFSQQLAAAGILFRRNEPLAPHTTFKIGGPAAWFCEPDSEAQLAQTLSLCRACGVHHYVLGRGSNVLFADEGFEGAVISVGKSISQIVVDVPAGRVCAQAGARLADVCRAAADSGLAGLEFAFGIPGTVGGAVYMNAGAYGGEMCDVLESVTFVDETGAAQILPASELRLGYRTSVFSQRDWCIIGAVLRLAEDDPDAIRARMTEYAKRRADKQPLDLPSAGSTFKRPEGAYAGALIEQCGLRGFAVGGAAVSEKHCGFVVNKGGATCADVIELTDRITQIVREKTGYVLEKEIRVVR